MTHNSRFVHFDEDHDGFQKNIQLFGFVSIKRKRRLKRHPLELPLYFNLRELIRTYKAKQMLQVP